MGAAVGEEGVEQAGGPGVRPARIADAAGIARVHVRSWQAAYRGVFPDPFLDALDPVERAGPWERTLSGAAGAASVADSQGEIVGFVLFGPSREREEGTGEVLAIYVLPEWWGRGLGRRLLSEAESRLRAGGHRRAVLWVLDANDRARRFYERAGWEESGRVKREPIFGVEATEVEYTRLL